MRNIRITIHLFIILATAFSNAAADEDRGTVIRIRSEYDGATVREKFAVGENHALVMGIDNYKHRNHPDLKTAVKDAGEVARLLREKYYFHKDNITLLINEKATKERIMQEFRDLVKIRVKKGDNVFIYYAGHGWYDETWRTGYWITTEASSPATYLENTMILKFIAALDRREARHILLVSDSCFSGSLTREHSSVETDIDDRYFREKHEKPSRNVITSGGLEPVADGGKKGHSIFAYYFLKILAGNSWPYLSGKQLGVKVEELVTRNSKQTPVCRYIHGVGDEGGQFFFINKLSEKMPMPDDGGASFDDIIKEGELRKSWSNWREKREKEYQKVREIDGNRYIAPKRKYEAWTRFRSAVKGDNPFSKDDDEMRSYAESRMSHWKHSRHIYLPGINWNIARSA